MVGDKFDLTLPIFKHWNKVFNKYNYQLVNSRYSSSNYFEYCVCILPIDKKDIFTYDYPCLVHGWGTKSSGMKLKQWKNLGSKFDCENSVELNKLLKQFIKELNTGNKSAKYLKEKIELIERLAEELSNLYMEWED